MRYGFYFLRSYWLAVPEFLYILLLFGSWITMIISISMTIRNILRKKEKKSIIQWVFILLVAFVIVVLTMTGKIVPNTAFGG